MVVRAPTLRSAAQFDISSFQLLLHSYKMLFIGARMMTTMMIPKRLNLDDDTVVTRK